MRVRSIKDNAPNTVNLLIFKENLHCNFNPHSEAASTLRQEGNMDWPVIGRLAASVTRLSK